MPSCEKCWRDAHVRAADRQTNVADEYGALIRERDDSHCSPEEQAGPGARVCPDCERQTVHQYADQCTICGRELPEKEV